MESMHTLRRRQPQEYPGYAVGEILAKLIVAGWRSIAGCVAAAARAQRGEKTRRELHGLSDHFLNDIGLHRDQINRLFR